VANIPTFTWFDTVAKVPQLGTYLASASAQGKSSGTPSIVEIIVYDLPDRDCAAAASNGEFSIANNGQANYFNYIDQIVAQITSTSRSMLSAFLSGPEHRFVQNSRMSASSPVSTFLIPYS
jgi:cellulase/cellobiase CelA1